MCVWGGGGLRGGRVEKGVSEGRSVCVCVCKGGGGGGGGGEREG